MPTSAISLSRERGFGKIALIIMESSSSALLKLHDGIAVLYMLELKPSVNQINPSKDR